MINDLANIIIRKRELEQQEAEVRNNLLKLMKQEQVLKAENDYATVQYIAAFNKNMIDREKLKRLYPDAEKKCTKSISMSESVRLHLKEGVEEDVFGVIC